MDDSRVRKEARVLSGEVEAALVELAGASKVCEGSWISEVL